MNVNVCGRYSKMKIFLIVIILQSVLLFLIYWVSRGILHNEENVAPELLTVLTEKERVWSTDFEGIVWEEDDEEEREYYLGVDYSKTKFGVDSSVFVDASCHPKPIRRCWRKPYSEESYDYHFFKRFSKPDSLEEEEEIKVKKSDVKDIDYPFIVVQSFLLYCDHVIKDDKYPFKNVSDGDLVCIENKYHEFPWYIIPKFLSHVKIILYLPPFHDRCTLCENMDFITDSENIVAIFTPSFDIMYHPKIIPMPYGIGYFTGHGRTTNTRNALESVGVVSETDDSSYSREKILSPLAFSSFNYRRNYLERLHLIDAMKDKEWAEVHAYTGSWGHNRTFNDVEYMKNLAKIKFSLCPKGNGMNTIRLLESLLVGTIPVVISSPMDVFLRGFPVVIVEKWEDLTESFLLQKFEELYGMKYNPERLFVNYYLKKIRNVKERIRLGLL